MLKPKCLPQKRGSSIEFNRSQQMTDSKFTGR